MTTYGTVVSLKQDLELLMANQPDDSGATPSKEVLHRLYDKIILIDETLLHNKSPIHDQWTINYLRNEFIYLGVSMGEDIQNLQDNVKFMNVCRKVSWMASRTFGSFNSPSLREHVHREVASIRKELEKELMMLFRKEELPKLYANVTLLDKFLRDYSGESYNREMMAKLEIQIKDVAEKADNLLFMNQPKAMVNISGKYWRYPIVYDVHDFTTLPRVRNEMASINKEMENFRNDRDVLEATKPQNLENPAYFKGTHTPVSNPSKRSPNRNCKLVGLKKDLEDMLGCLTRDTLDLKVLPVIGMAGIGKTTFVRELYHHPLVLHHFYVCAWITVSQEFQLRGMLLGLLSCTTNLSDEIYEMKDEQLMEQLYRSVKGRRYLIVLDDVWDKNAWDVLRRAFPNDNNGSRVLLTSRLRDVAVHVSPNVPPHCLRCLSLEESWELLCLKIFENETCPEELLPVGKQIAYKCHGLPLAIVIVGGLLSKVNGRLNSWEEVAQNVGSLVMDDPQHCQSIIALSYSHLPDPLKICFLYLGIFPEDYEISSQKLISLWIAEGFVLPKKQKLLEEVAKGYLEDLIARSLIMVKRRGSDGRVKTCYIHDMMREFCLRESQKENFLHVILDHGGLSLKNDYDFMNYYYNVLGKDLLNLRRLAFYSNIRTFMKIGASFLSTRSFFCFEALRPTDLKGCFGLSFKLLKILDIMHMQISELPEGIALLCSLKYLALTIQQCFHVSSLSNLSRLETCIVDGEWSGNFCRELLDMAEIRHLKVKRRSPPSSDLVLLSGFMFSRCGALQNLQSLSTVGPSCCTKDVFFCMPNLRKLGVYGTEEDSRFVAWFTNLVFLKKLETLKYAFSNPFASSRVRPRRFPSWTVLPPNLRKLSLSGTSFPWEDMYQLSMLPKLEVIKLKNYAFSGAVWKLGTICFNSLKFLQIGSTNLAVWEADGSHFPSLEHLVLRHCRSLKEIPHGIGEAPLLEKIELHCCGDSAAASARQLQEELENEGNDLLTIYITER